VPIILVRLADGASASRAHRWIEAQETYLALRKPTSDGQRAFSIATCLRTNEQIL